MNGCDMYRIEPDAPKKPTAMNIFGMILQTVFAVVSLRGRRRHDVLADDVARRVYVRD